MSDYPRLYRHGMTTGTAVQNCSKPGSSAPRGKRKHAPRADPVRPRASGARTARGRVRWPTDHRS